MNTTAADNDNAFVLSLTQERKLEVPEKQDFFDHLLRSLDTLIYLLFAATYAGDNSVTLLIIRLANQIVHIRSPAVAQLPPTILVSLVCVVTHLLLSLPSGERLHGGILIDFVGEVAATTSRLLLLDTLVFGLQLVMLVVGHEKLHSPGNEQAAEGLAPQDLDHEEAGQLRSRAQDEANETNEGIEMQSLLRDRAGEEGSTHQKRDDPGGQDDDVIILDMKRGLKTLMRRPPSMASSAVTESSPAGVSLTTFLSRVAAARARAA